MPFLLFVFIAWPSWNGKRERERKSEEEWVWKSFAVTRLGCGFERRPANNEKWNFSQAVLVCATLWNYDKSHRRTCNRTELASAAIGVSRYCLSPFVSLSRVEFFFAGKNTEFAFFSWPGFRSQSFTISSPSSLLSSLVHVPTATVAVSLIEIHANEKCFEMRKCMTAQAARAQIFLFVPVVSSVLSGGTPHHS